MDNFHQVEGITPEDGQGKTEERIAMNPIQETGSGEEQ